MSMHLDLSFPAFVSDRRTSRIGRSELGRLVEPAAASHRVWAMVPAALVAGLTMLAAEPAVAQSVVGWGQRGFSKIDSTAGGVGVACAFGTTVVVKANGSMSCMGYAP
ncbi:MAG: hypothetical protein RIR65_660, partial [Planctomycetota bacterium]